MTIQDQPDARLTTNRAVSENPVAEEVTDPRQLSAIRSVGHIRRMLNERANSVAYGDTERVERLDIDLREAGYAGSLTETDVDDNGVPIGRSSGRPNVVSPVITEPVNGRNVPK